MTQMNVPHPDPHDVHIVVEIDGKIQSISFDHSAVTGRAIREKAGAPFADDMTRIVHGKPSGGNIGLDEKVEIHNGDRFIALPTGTVNDHIQPSASAETGGAGPHGRSIEVKVRFGEKYGVIVALGADIITSIKVRSLTALELSTDAAGEYVLRSGDREVEDEAQTLHHFLGGHEHHHVEFHLKKRHHALTYFVDDVKQTTTEHKLTMRSILDHAGYAPAEMYTLASIAPCEDYGEDYDRLVHLHDGQHFKATLKVPALVTIYVDDKELQIAPGTQTIVEIKNLGGVSLADQLQQEKDGGLIKLDQNGSVTIYGNERFVSFAATGGSS